MEETDFNAKYWFPNTVLVTVANPRKEDYKFAMVVQTGLDMATGRQREEQRQYRVKAGSNERFPGPIANLYLDQMAKILSQDDEKIQFMIDFSLRAEYYDRLIVSTEDLIQQYHENPAYLQNTEEKPVETVTPKEEAFADAKKDTAKKA